MYAMEVVDKLCFLFNQKINERIARSSWSFSDIYLASYPKSGNTWVCFILANIFNLLWKENRRIDHYSVHDYIPDIHANPEDIVTIRKPRIIKTHESFDEWNRRISIKGRGLIYPRVLYIVRDGRNVMVSYYKFIKGFSGYSGSYKEFLSDFAVRRGEWASHVKGWLFDNKSTLEEKKIKIIKYEDLKINTLQVVLEILDFAGIFVDETIVEKAIALSEIDYCRQLEKNFGIPNKPRQPNFEFARKGVVGLVEDEFKKETDLFFREEQDLFKKLNL